MLYNIFINIIYTKNQKSLRIVYIQFKDRTIVFKSWENVVFILFDIG